MRTHSLEELQRLASIARDFYWVQGMHGHVVAHVDIVKLPERWTCWRRFCVKHQILDASAGSFPEGSADNFIQANSVQLVLSFCRAVEQEHSCHRMMQVGCQVAGPMGPMGVICG